MPGELHRLFGDTFPEQHDANCLDRDFQIEKNACVADVPDIEGRLIFRGNIPATCHLRPAGQPRPDHQAGKTVFRLIACQQGARANEGHIAAKYVDELGQLVEPGPAHEAAPA